MPTCCQCEGIERQFGDRTARRELRRYRRRGPSASTRLLVEMLREAGVHGATLLDVGGGVGVLQHELLAAGARSAVHVDASTHYLLASRQEAERRGHAGRVTYLHGDFVELADQVAPADVVTLDRVICCYPDMRRLVKASAARAESLYGLVYPRVRVGTRLAVSAGNLLYRLRGIPFRGYLHSPAEVHRTVEGQGFTRIRQRNTLLWHVALYARRSVNPPAA